MTWLLALPHDHPRSPDRCCIACHLDATGQRFGLQQPRYGDTGDASGQKYTGHAVVPTLHQHMTGYDRGVRRTRAARMVTQQGSGTWD